MGKIITPYEIIKAEWHKQGGNDFHTGDAMTKDNITFFDNDQSFMKKSLTYDDDIHQMVNDKLFIGNTLSDADHDRHFKQMFFQRFHDRDINRQTIESFNLLLVSHFLVHKDFIERVYRDLDQFLAHTQTNEQSGDSRNDTQNRSAFSDLPGNTVNLDVENSVMTTASDNTVSLNKQTAENKSSGLVKQYRLDELFKTNGILDSVLIDLDRACFLQTW